MHSKVYNINNEYDFLTNRCLELLNEAEYYDCLNSCTNIQNQEELGNIIGILLQKISEIQDIINKINLLKTEIKNLKGDLANEIIKFQEDLSSLNRKLGEINLILLALQDLLNKYKVLFHEECLSSVYLIKENEYLEERNNLVIRIEELKKEIEEYKTSTDKQNEELLLELRKKYGTNILELLKWEIIFIGILLALYFLFCFYKVPIPKYGAEMISGIAIAVFVQSIALVTIVLQSLFNKKGIFENIINITKIYKINKKQ